MSEEIELASKAIGQVAGALVDESQALGPVRARLEAITLGIHYRYFPRTVQQAVRAAELIEESGLPRAAFDAIPDPLLRAILTGGSMAEDTDMQERWANLLANAETGCPGMRIAFATALSEMEPLDAALLDALGDSAGGEVDPRSFPVSDVSQSGRDERASLDNLVRLELARYTRPVPVKFDDIDDSLAPLQGVMLTELGLQFLEACRPPSARA